MTEPTHALLQRTQQEGEHFKWEDDEIETQRSSDHKDGEGWVCFSQIICLYFIWAVSLSVLSQLQFHLGRKNGLGFLKNSSKLFS